MRKGGEFFVVVGFFVLISLIAAGAFWVVGTLARQVNPGGDAWTVWMIAGVLALLATGLAVKLLHGRLERWVNRHAR